MMFTLREATADAALTVKMMQRWVRMWLSSMVRISSSPLTLDFLCNLSRESRVDANRYRNELVTWLSCFASSESNKNCIARQVVQD